MQIVDKRFKKDTGYSVLVISVAVGLALGIFMILPKYKQLSDSNNALAAKNTQIALLNTDKDNISASISQLSQESSQIARINQAIPNSQNLPDLYAYLETLAQSANLQITALQAIDNTPATAGTDGSTGATATTATNQAQTNGSGASNTGVAGLQLPENIGVTNLNIQVSGGIDNFNQFLKALENSLRVMDVQTINVGAVQDRDQLSFQVGLTTYYQK